ncbi:hypothetical protein CRUP_032279, partial [Coryphaenoides rupestris]
MDEDGLPIVGSGVDLTKVPAIQQRRVVAYLNQFIVHTLSSIPGLDEVTIDSISQRPAAAAAAAAAETNGPTANQSQQPDPVADNVVTVARDPRYARYLKMVQV